MFVLQLVKMNKVFQATSYFVEDGVAKRVYYQVENKDKETACRQLLRFHNDRQLWDAEVAINKRVRLYNKVESLDPDYLTFGEALLASCIN